MIRRNQPNQASAFIFNRIFIAGLLLLFLNDHYLKWEYSNWVTGKLSDFTGLLIFPMFLQFLFPRFFPFSLLVTGVLFILWKLPLSGPFIAFYNRFAIIPITRTVDYSDLFALSVLPLAGYFIKRIDLYKIPVPASALLSYLALIPVSLLFMATSPPESYTIKKQGYIYIGKSYKLKVSKEEALARLKKEGFAYEADTSQHRQRDRSFYVIKNAVLEDGKDTLQFIRFGFSEDKGKTKLYINNVSVKETDDTKHWRLLRKYYRRLVQSGIVEDVE